MSNIVIGSSSWAYNDTSKMGWNTSTKIVYGNSTNDSFSFTDGNWASAFISQGWSISANGAAATGGNDTLNFSAATSGITFDEAKVTGANGVSIIGSAFDDQFNWAGTTFTLNGGSGTDTLYLNNTANGTNFVLGNVSMTNMEVIAGSAFNDGVIWNGQGTYTFNLGAGTNTLNISNATAGKEINLYDSKYTNIQVVNGSSLADTLRGTSAPETLNGGDGADILYGGDGTDIDSLVGGAGADTFYWTRGYGNDVIVANESVDTLKLTDVALADLSIGSAAPKIVRSGDNVEFRLVKDGADTGIEVTAAGTDTIAVAKVALTDSTFNLFVSKTTSPFSGSSLADLIYGNDTTGTSLNGGLGADTLVGGAGNDTFVYSSSSVFFGQSGAADLLDASASATGVEINLYDTAKFNGIEYVSGSSLADVIRGASTNDSLYGGAGADILYGGVGLDTLKGGAGADTYWFKASEGDDVIAAGANAEENKLNASDVVRLSGVNYADLTFGLTPGNDAQIGFKTATGYTGTLTVENFADQDVYGSSANVYRVNTFVTDDKTFGLAMGNDNANTLVGTSLDDYILSYATTGAVSIDGGAGIDTIYAGAGNDYVKFDAADAIVNGGGGTDTLYMAAAGMMDVRDSAIYNSFSVLKGSDGADVIRGGSMSETLVGGDGADDLWGYTGNDVLKGNNGADNYWFTTGDGVDTIADDAVSNKQDTVHLAGLAFGDLSFGFANGTDAVIAAGTDSLNLANWISYNNDSATANLKRVNNFVTTDKTFGLAIGNDVASTLYGTSMDDYILGGAGSDTLKGGAGVDSLYGGAGNDFLYYSAEDAVFNGGDDLADTLSAATSTAAVELNLYDSKITGIEYLEGSTLGDVLRGSDASGETLNGGKGADHLYGGKGADSLVGGAGADTYWFGALDGADTISRDTVNNGSDVVNFYGLTRSQLTFERINSNLDLKISVNADQGYTDNLVLQNWGDDTVVANRVSTFVTSDATFGLAIGTSNAETLLGTSIGDYIAAGDGNDTINSGLGADTILGGAGDDSIIYKSTIASLDGGDGTDVLTAAAATAAVEIDLRNVDSTKTQYTSIESVIGSSLADILRGSASDETLDGGLGADNLWGAAGADVMTGGAGVDTYWFGVGDGADTISASTANNTDYVKFYGGIDGNSIQSTVVSGDNLMITLTSGDALTLTDWNKTDGSKLNNFDFGAAGVWGLSVASDGTTATWTRRNS